MARRGETVQHVLLVEDDDEDEIRRFVRMALAAGDFRRLPPGGNALRPGLQC